jgi:hypothetical protein
MNTVNLAEKYKDSDRMDDADIPALVRDFKRHGLAEEIPRLFYHLNRESFDPDSRFPALAESIKLLNPKVENLNFSHQAEKGGGWKIDISENPDLDDISPLCGLDIRSLNASGIGSPDLKLLTEDGMTELRLSGTALNHLFELDQMEGIETLDISGTHIRNLVNIVKYSQLTSLDISGIDGLSISPQLVWCRNLRTLTVAESFNNDPTIQTLDNRGVIIIYTDE